MLAVGIETSGRIGSVCAVRDGVAAVEEVFSEGLSHGRELAPAFLRALESAGAVPEDADLLGVSAGPGSYTGIRIGTVFAAILSEFLGVPAIAVSSLEALAESGPSEEILVPVVDARWGMVYAAAFRRGAGLVRLMDDSILRPEELLEAAPEGGVIFGSGAEAYAGVLSGRFRAIRGDFRIGSAAVAGIAARRARDGAPAGDLSPRYLKPWGPPCAAGREEA